MRWQISVIGKYLVNPKPWPLFTFSVEEAQARRMLEALSALPRPFVVVAGDDHSSVHPDDLLILHLAEDGARP